MLLTPHALVGATIGASSDNLTYIIILAFLSHFILDSLPHFDWGMWHNYQDFSWKDMKVRDYLLETFDILMLLILALYLWYNLGRNNYILIGAFFGILVDLIDNVPFWKRYLQKLPLFSQLHLLHMSIHNQLKAKYWVWGILTQIFIIVISLTVLFNI